MSAIAEDVPYRPEEMTDEVYEAYWEWGRNQPLAPYEKSILKFTDTLVAKFAAAEAVIAEFRQHPEGAMFMAWRDRADELTAQLSAATADRDAARAQVAGLREATTNLTQHLLVVCRDKGNKGGTCEIVNGTPMIDAFGLLDLVGKTEAALASAPVAETERGTVANECVKWVGDDEHCLELDDNGNGYFCVFCKAESSIWAGAPVAHKPDCLHLRAAAIAAGGEGAGK